MKDMVQSLTCEVFPGQTCVLPEGPGQHWNCPLCTSVVSWLNGSFDTVYLQQSPSSPQILSLVPAHAEEAFPASCLMEISSADHTPREICSFLHCLAGTHDQVWVAAGTPSPHSERLKP